MFELVVEELLDRRCPDAALEAAAFAAAAGASFGVGAAAVEKGGSCSEASVAVGCAASILSLTKPSWPSSSELEFPAPNPSSLPPLRRSDSSADASVVSLRGGDILF